jgi:hypothetical protein
MMTGAMLTEAIRLVPGGGTLGQPSQIERIAIQARLADGETWALARLDRGEHERRRSCGLGALTDRDCLRFLSCLPEGEPVRLVDLTNAEREQLSAVPVGAVDMSRNLVTRRARPPISIGLVVVADDDAERGLDRASEFAQFCARMLVLGQRPDDLVTLKMEACFYGIGLAVVRDSALSVILHPEPTSMTPGPVSWRLLEQVYAAHLEQDALAVET